MKRLACFISTWAFAATMMLGLAGIPAARAQLEVLDENQAPGRTMAQQATKERQIWITADHSRHEVLQKEFNSGPEVTKACLSCHELAAGQFHKTIHWTWLDPNVPAGERIGKAGLSINNFCINLNGNEPRCTSCHAGYGWRDEQFQFQRRGGRGLLGLPRTDRDLQKISHRRGESGPEADRF